MPAQPRLPPRLRPREPPRRVAPRTTARGFERDGRPALVIVESPTKAKTIGKYLGSGYDVKATVGHLRDLPTRELGVDVENGFEPKYVTIKGKTKTLAELKKAAKGASAIYLATDPDREGEAIAWHVADQIRQAWRFHSTTASCSTRSPRRPFRRRSGTRARSTTARWMPSRPAAFSTVWWATRPAPSSGTASRPASRPAGSRPSRSG